MNDDTTVQWPVDSTMLLMMNFSLVDCVLLSVYLYDTYCALKTKMVEMQARFLKFLS